MGAGRWQQVEGIDLGILRELTARELLDGRIFEFEGQVQTI
jgi:hypothetical protein